MIRRAKDRLRQYSRAAVGAAFIFVPTVSFAQSEAEFFQGKTLRMIVSTTPGGGYDLRGRALSRHLGRFLPGHPSIVVENMPGGGSIVAMNYTYNVAPKDGTVLCLFQRTTLTTPILSPNGVRFDLARFNWVGSMGQDNGLLVSWRASAIQTTQDLFSKEMIVGTSAQTTMPMLLNALIGTKLKIISGYPGAPEMQLAMQRGEIMGPGEWSWSEVRSSELFRQKQINLLLQTGIRRNAELPDVPLALDYTRTEEDHRILEVFVSPRQVAYPVVLPPDVPPQRVKAIRDAFLAMGSDPEFKADLKKSGAEFDVIPGEEVEALVARTAALPAPLLTRMRSLLEP